MKSERNSRFVASIGVSFNKFLAKIASDWKKPDGLFEVKPEDALRFIDQLPIESFWGIGPATAKKMHGLGISTGEELRRQPLSELVRLFGSCRGNLLQLCCAELIPGR